MFIAIVVNQSQAENIRIYSFHRQDLQVTFKMVRSGIYYDFCVSGGPQNGGQYFSEWGQNGL